MTTRDKRGYGQHTVVGAVGGSTGGSAPTPQPSRASDDAGKTSRHKPVGIAATLVAIDGDLEGQAFVLVPGDNHLGRGADCAPLLESRWISRSHAHLICERGSFLVRASEGKEIWVNDVQTPEAYLQDGDRLRLGTTVFMLRTVTGGDGSGSSVIPVQPSGSGAHAVPEVAAAAARPAPPPAKRKRPFWRFWQKSSPSLVFLRGERAGERVDLDSARVRIGGLQSNDVVIGGIDASRNHAELRVRGGRVHIWDLRSVNGTWVNEQRIENIELRSGDVIRIGSEELRFED